MSSPSDEVQQAKKSVLAYAKEWGSSPLPPTVLATLITSLHARPFQPLPLLFAPVLLFSSYVNLASYVVDSAGMTAAWSGLYFLLASRRRGTKGVGVMRNFQRRFGARGLVRGSAIGLAAINVGACGYTYAVGRGNKEDKTK
ncbi:hypothetical protein F5884DRAFT_766936 [Xylogone sp. PMI_703]|nr:hypothetical protein F5884DRAFT_766936 [Xylogone sp. PMI_703]